jgi:capsular polysaccharide biosynthesis protein
MPSGIDTASDEMRRNKSGRGRWVMVLFLLISLGAVTAIWLSLREYRSVVTTEVHMDEFPNTPLEFERFSGSQEETLRQSDEILRPVIERFDLTRVLSPNGRPLSFIETKDRLAESIEVWGIPYSGLLEVSVYHRNPELASGIANAIVESFNEQRVKEDRMRMDRVLAQLASEIEVQRTRAERARKEMTDSKERGGIIDPDPERVVPIKTGTDKALINQYEAVKALFLNEKRILEAGELKLRVEKQDAPNYKFEPVKIWKRADPSQHRPHINLQRIWTRHKLLCILGLITGAALAGLSIVAAIVHVVKIQRRTSPHLPDTTTYDY